MSSLANIIPPSDWVLLTTFGPLIIVLWVGVAVLIKIVISNWSNL